MYDSRPTPLHKLDQVGDTAGVLEARAMIEKKMGKKLMVTDEESTALLQKPATQLEKPKKVTQPVTSRGKAPDATAAPSENLMARPAGPVMRNGVGIIGMTAEQAGKTPSGRNDHHLPEEHPKQATDEGTDDSDADDEEDAMDEDGATWGDTTFENTDSDAHVAELLEAHAEGQATAAELQTEMETENTSRARVWCKSCKKESGTMEGNDGWYCETCFDDNLMEFNAVEADVDIVAEIGDVDNIDAAEACVTGVCAC